MNCNLTVGSFVKASPIAFFSRFSVSIWNLINTFLFGIFPKCTPSMWYFTMPLCVILLTLSAHGDYPSNQHTIDKLIILCQQVQSVLQYCNRYLCTNLIIVITFMLSINLAIALVMIPFCEFKLVLCNISVFVRFFAMIEHMIFPTINIYIGLKMINLFVGS